jgi:hypothetical protein
MDGTFVPGNAPSAAASPEHGVHLTFAASSLPAASGSLAVVGEKVASMASASAIALSEAASTEAGPMHQSPHAPDLVSESNTAGTPAAVSGFAAPHS